MPKTITKLSKQDSAILLRMHNDVFISSYWDEASWNRFLSPDKKLILCVIKKKGSYTGFIMGRPTHKLASTILLNTLIVLPEHRKNGHGKLLVDFFLRTAFALPQTKKVILHFRESNKNTLLPYYKKLGFGNHSVCGKYSNGENKHYLSLTKSSYKKISK